jgi:tripartite ATP-independent transporter DctM subunit
MAGALCGLVFLILTLLGVPVVFSLGFSAVSVGLLTYGVTCLPKAAWTPFYGLYNLGFVALPLFVLIGCIIAETPMGTELYDMARKWLSRLRGGLVAAGIIGEAVMAAAIGTSMACILVVGKSAVRELEKYGYRKEFGLGALLAGGCLGPLIPPSMPMIIYSVLANVSLGRLFTAGIIPGIILTAMLSLTALAICRFKPEWAFTPQAARLAKEEERFTWGERLAALRRTWPLVALILAILGSIYMGLATPAEASGIGSVVALLLALLVYGVRASGLRRALEETAVINGIIMFILIGASFFSYIMGSANIAKYLPALIESWGISRWTVIIVINVILLILGCLLDAATITFLTVPIFVPLVTALGFDPIWFGVVFLVNTQIGVITPPVGMDTFTAANVFGVPVGDLVRGVLPFLIVLLVFLAIVTAFPQLSLWLVNVTVAG